MKTTGNHFLTDMSIMLGRSMKHIFRSIDTIITVCLTPIAMMLLFVYVFGGAMGSGMSTQEYVTYSLPGILLIAIASASAYTAIRIFEDIRSGFFDRLNSMPISASSALWAHVLTSLISNALSLAIILVVAFLMGFRSPAGILNCLGAAGILTFFTLALTWIAAFAGLKARTADGAGAFAYPLVFLPFISSAFLSTETMPAPVRAFAQNQPVTAIVDSVRALLMNQPVGSEIWTALAWCTGILLIAYFMSMRAYKRRRS
ncbi:ABC transporter permease [uncultured Robinsoniella sp.]|uniref:ABC transporter permease n=1 Tax=uncultured Robinsoniella sp. TaxID=904190 RepID=UPI00374F46D5